MYELDKKLEQTHSRIQLAEYGYGKTSPTDPESSTGMSGKAVSLWKTDFAIPRQTV